jgi:hypothetical protein
MEPSFGFFQDADTLKGYCWHRTVSNTPPYVIFF